MGERVPSSSGRAGSGVGGSSRGSGNAHNVRIESGLSERSAGTNTSWTSTASIPVAIALAVAGATVVLVMSASRMFASQRQSKAKVGLEPLKDKESGDNAAANASNSGPAGAIAVADSPKAQAAQPDSKSLLTRQLLADPNFQLPSSAAGPEDPVERRVSEMFKKAMWDMVEKDIAQGNFERFFALVVELRERLVAVTPRRSDLAADLRRALDVELIKQQVSQPGFNVESWNVLPLCEFVLGRIRALEAPARNAETDAWMATFSARTSSQDSSRVTLLKEFFDYAHSKLDLIAVDTTNAYLRHIAPTVTQHGVELSKQNFDKRLKDGSLSLERSQAWADNVKALLAQTESEKDRSKQGEGTAALALQEIHRTGVLELILPGGMYGLDARGDVEEAEQVYSGCVIPETMLDEQTTLFALFQEALQLWRTAYAILRIRQLVPESSPAMMNELYALLHAGSVERVNVKGSPDGKLTTVQVMGVSSLSRKLADAAVACVQKHTGTLDSEDASALRELLRKAFNPKRVRNEPTYQLVAKRLRSMVSGLVVPRSDEVRKRNMLALPEALKSLRLGPLGENIVHLASKTYDFADRDFAIHNTTYAMLFRHEV